MMDICSDRYEKPRNNKKCNRTQGKSSRMVIDVFGATRNSLIFVPIRFYVPEFWAPGNALKRQR